MNNSLFIFRRDYRLNDNTALIKALSSSDNVLCIFIFSPDQIGKNNDYKSNNFIQLIIKALNDLKEDIPLYIFYGDTIKVIKDILSIVDISNIFLNGDYTPYAINRDKNIIQTIDKHNKQNKTKIKVNIYHDSLLMDPGKIKTDNGTIYTKFTPYFRKAYKLYETDEYKKYQKVMENKFDNYLKLSKNQKKELEYLCDNDFVSNIKYLQFDFNENININYDNTLRFEAIKILKKIVKFDNYNDTRNLLNKKTTHLSMYIRSGIVSIREVYSFFITNLKNNNDLIKQLFWREFYYNIGYYFPTVFSGAMNTKFNNIKWENNKEYFKLWCDGNTGYPVVDACMRELNTTGYMHNRGRLIVSNFLIKILLIDWRWGEKYFATQLLDYDPMVNNGNWQWSSSTGTDSQPYFRLFNPWIQSKKFDKDCNYIKKWVPELNNVNNNDIHDWCNTNTNYKKIKYSKPLFDDHKKRGELAVKLYKN